jgi:peroxiredoxin Q/BCP
MRKASSTVRMPGAVLVTAAFLSGCGANPAAAGGDGLLPPGADLPDLPGVDQDGRPHRLQEAAGAPTVVYFYPKDETPGCTKEACAFRDVWKQYEAAGVRLFGVSRDTAASHKAFAGKHRLTFPLISDEDGAWAAAFGVPGRLGMYRRVTFLFGRDGKVAKVYADVNPGLHALEVLADVGALDGGQGHHGHQDKRFTDPAEQAVRWNDPGRDEWQKPAEVVAAMGIEPGMTVADVGAGTGYFVPRLSAAVGEGGRALAVDIEQGMLDFIAKLAAERGLSNVGYVLAALDDPRLPEGGIDRILIVNTWHHIADREIYGAKLRRALKPGGSVWVVDFRKDAPDGPPVEYRLPPAAIAAELEAAGFAAEIDPLVLPRQHVVVGRLR